MRHPWFHAGGLVILTGLSMRGPVQLAMANPCPCREQYVAGRHVYVGAPQKEVRVESENLLFRVQRPTSWLHHVAVEITVDYVLFNRGKARELVIGFPIGMVHNAKGDVSSFQVRGDGVGPRVVPDRAQQKDWVADANPSECEADLSADAYVENYDWYLWKQALHPGANRLHVRYLQRWFVQDGEVTVNYVLRTARRWGNGRIGKLHIELRDPGLPSNVRWKGTPKPTEVRDRGRSLIWSLPEHRPVRDLHMEAVFHPGPEDRFDDE